MSPLQTDLFAKAKAESHPSKLGTTYFWRPAKGILLTRVEGTLTLEAGLAMERTIRRVITEDRRLAMFNDLEAMTDYDSDVRTQITKALLDQKASLDAVHALFNSRIVALGVQTANLVLKIIVAHSQRASFEGAVREALHKRRG